MCSNGVCTALLLKSFSQVFSKTCGFQRQRLGRPSQRAKYPILPKTQERVNPSGMPLGEGKPSSGVSLFGPCARMEFAQPFLFAQTIFKHVILSLSNFWMRELGRTHPKASDQRERRDLQRGFVIFPNINLLLLNTKTTKLQRRSRFASLAL